MIKPDEIVPLLILEWIKGDKEGETEIVKDIEVMGEFTWVNFQGGGRINGHVINEMMIAIGVATPEDVEKQNFVKQERQVKSDSITPVSKITQPTSLPKPNNTFGFDILNKAQRDSKMTLAFEIDFQFISEEKIKMLLELYGEELYISLKDYIRQQVTEQVITDCIEQYLLYSFPKPEEQIEFTPNTEYNE